MTCYPNRAAGSMLLDAVIAMVVIAVLGMLSIRQSIVVAQSRADRASMEAMQELVAFYLSEARLADCVPLTTPPSSPDPDSVCFAPFVGHVSSPSSQHQPTFTVTKLNGRTALFEVALEDTYSPLEYGVQWPVRTATVTDSTGRLTLERSAVGKP